MISNDQARVHCLLTDEEKAQGATTSWTELEVHGNNTIVLNLVNIDFGQKINKKTSQFFL